MGLALHNFNDQYKHFPTGGEGTYPESLGINNGKTYFDLHSVFTMILPFMEHEDVYQQINLTYAYDDPAAPQNIVATSNVVPEYLCPSNPLRESNGQDNEGGYGYTDYGPTVYTDIDPVTGVRNKNTRAHGGLHATSTTNAALGAQVGGGKPGILYTPGTPWTNGGTVPIVMSSLGVRHGDIRDGLSKTIAISEDVGRNDQMTSPYTDPVAANGTVSPPQDAAGTRAFWRWAEPDNGFGVSGDPLYALDVYGTVGLPAGGTANPNSYGPTAINNNAFPFGGGNYCPWNQGFFGTGGYNTGDYNNNCGPNDEMFGFHGRGCNVVFMDGHVTFLSADTPPQVVRYLVTAQEGIPIPPGNDY
jgi:prepilin-type processing-associated H-X9-DG protein